MAVHTASGSRAAVFVLLGHDSEAITARFGPAGFSRHYHETYSFGLVASGMNQFRYRRRTFQAVAGTIGICDPGEVHDGGMARMPWAYRAAFPSAEAMSALAAEIGMHGLPAFDTGHIVDPVSVASLHRFLALLFEEDPACRDHALEEAGIDAFATIIRRNAVGVRPHHRAVECPRIAAEALTLMHDRWEGPVPLSDMAEAAGASRYATIRSVARATGLTPHAYLLQLRVCKAKELLRQGVPAAAAAADTGFVDQSHLSRAMRQRWGVGPGAFSTAYRRALRTMAGAGRPRPASRRPE